MITINETLYKKMPDDIKACFKQLPNPSSEEVRECFPETNTHGGGKGSDNKADWGLKSKVIGEYKNDSGNASRFFKSIIYQAKASKSERNKGCEGLEEKERINYGGFHSEKGLIENNRNPENRKPTTNNHPTVKPIALMEYLIKMITPPKGIVLDPFAGSGSTLVAAKELGFNFIGIEKEEEYIKIIEARLSAIPDRLL
jgi:site-specific DNA-methyltransferase (adenine-specific)